MLHMYRYITIHSINFVFSLLSENLKNIECEIMKYYNDLLQEDSFSCKYIQKYEILNYNVTTL
jgi:hypothetical protein